MARTTNSSTIPSFLLKALGHIRKAQLGSTTNVSVPSTEVQAKSPQIVRKASVNVIPVSGISERKLVAHGAGVYEDPQNGAIWYKEGNFLKRRQEDIDRIISDYVSPKA